MPLKKIADLPKIDFCRHPEHDPPNMIVLSPGIYEHTCPGCGHKTTFRVDHGPTLSSEFACGTAAQARKRWL